MKKDKEWLKEEIWKQDIVMDKGYIYTDDLMSIINEVDEPEVPVIPQFVADYLVKAKQDIPLLRVFDIANNFNEIDKWKKEYEWIRRNSDLFARAWLDGYEVEKEILWEIPMPDLKTTGGHIQYLTYDSKARTYFASRQNGRLKQTFNAKDLASVPGQYRRYAELRDFKKIEEATEWSWTE